MVPNEGANVAWNAYNMQSRNLDNASMNGSGSGSGGKLMIRQTGCLQSAANNRVLTCNIGEGRGGKRLHKNSSNNPTPARPAEPTPAAAMRTEPFSVPATRRRQSSFRDQTFRDQRALPTSTSLQASPSKRYDYYCCYACIKLIFADWLITASQTPKALNELLLPALRKSRIRGRTPMATSQGSASPLPPLSVGRMFLMSQSLSISSRLSTSMISTPVSELVNPTLMPSQNQAAV